MGGPSYFFWEDPCLRLPESVEADSAGSAVRARGAGGISFHRLLRPNSKIPLMIKQNGHISTC